MAPPAGATLHPRTARVRLVGPDVTRAIALIGVVLMNYHGYLNGAAALTTDSSPFVMRLFNPWTGVLSTRFAATFVLVAGVGVTLLTNRSRLGGDRAAVSADRWRLARRGLLLYAAGMVIDWIWPGTILPYYGVLFLLAAVLFTLRTRWVAAVGSAAMLGAVAVQWWGASRARDGRYPDWLFAPNTLANRTPRGLLFDAFVNGTHPMLPWLTFLCAGIVIGRAIPHVPYLRLGLAAAAVTASTYAIAHWVTPGEADSPLRLAVLSTRPNDRALLYTLCTLGSAVAAFCFISYLAERAINSGTVRTLQLAGQTSLSLYLGHIAFFNIVVGRLEWVRPTGLDTAIVLTLTYWVLAVAAAALWQRRFGIGPAEWVYRRFGG
ncbi:MAG: DUF418 domain-containing protein [Actinomycetota bacterium]